MDTHQLSKTLSLREYDPLFRMEDAPVGAPVDAGRWKCGTFIKSARLEPMVHGGGIKILSDNRAAGHNYYLLDRYEAGLALTGTEVKAAKTGKVQLKESYAEISEGEAWLMNAHISEYSHGNIMNHMPVRKRKLLLHRGEIDKLQEETREKGLTLIPTRVYLKSGRIKVEIAVAKGKKFHDKREAVRAKEMQAEAKAALARRARR